MIDTLSGVRSRDVERILREVEPDTSRRARPALVVLVGLPAAGKSRIAEELRARTGAVVIESDAIRRLLFASRTYSPEESRHLFETVHAAIERLLGQGAAVILDATNVAEAERTPLYAIADRRGAKLVLVHVEAPAALARQRLRRRARSGIASSEADLDVHARMQVRFEPIARPHHTVDTSGDIKQAVAAIAREMTS